MGCTHDKMLRADHLIPGAPPLDQPSHTNNSDTGLNHTEEENQKTYGISGKLGANDGWEFQQGCSGYRITNRTTTTLTPSPVWVKEVVEGAPVGTGPIIKDPTHNPTHHQRLITPALRSYPPTSQPKPKISASTTS